VLAKAKLEQLKNEKPNVPAETPEIEITPSEPVEGSNDGISLGKSWNLSERASVLQTLTNLENQSLISKREREELMEANTKLVESFNQFEDEYRAKDTVRTAAQIRLILSIKEQLVGTQVKVASLTEDLNATRGRGIETLKELIATQNDLAEVRKNLVSSEKNGRQLEADLAETRRELVSSEKKVKQLDAEVMALLEILKKNDIVIQP
jgi:chromosome segregation ATPase